MLIIPVELNKQFENNKQLITAFNLLSTSKKREYANYISEAKREQTKLKRLEKIIPMIIDGIGLYDKYKN